MKKKLLILLLPCAMAQVRSQSASPFVTVVGGSYYGGSLFTVSATVGELSAVETFSKPSLILTQGFQQYEDVAIGIKTEPEFTFDGTVYPNPAKDDIYLNYNLASSAGVYIELVDLLGNKVGAEYYEEGPGTYTHLLATDGLNNGIYLLRVRCLFKNQEAQINTYRFSIVK